MAIVWTKTGDCYVHKTLGNDTTGNGSAQLPYASWNKAKSVVSSGSVVVISCGIWSEALNSTVKNITWQADGYAVIDLSNALTTSYMCTSGDILVGFIVFNPYFRLIYNGVYGCIHRYISCVIDNIYNPAAGSPINLTQCVVEVVRVTTIDSNRATLSAVMSTIVKIDSGGITTSVWIRNCSNSIIGTCVAPLVMSLQAAIYFCCFISHSSSGTNGIIANPLFTNANVGDYTLTADSPCLYAGYLGAHIGARGLGMRIDANHASFNKANGAVYSISDALTDDIVRVTLDVGGYNDTVFVLNSGKVSGSVISAWIDLGQLRDISGIVAHVNAQSNVSGVPTVVPSRSYSNENMRYVYRMKHSIDVAGKATAVWSDMEVLAYYGVSMSARYIQLELFLLSC